MREFNPLAESTLDETMRILRNAYPAADLPSPEEHRDTLLECIERDNVHVWTVHEGGQQLAVLRTHDFVMNAFGHQVPVQGLGGVAVDLCHKKKQVAKDLVLWFMQRSCALGVGLTALYPFRISFYQRMGWGLGTPTHRFHLAPRSFPETSEAGTARYLVEGDEDALFSYLDGVQGQTHGLFHVPRADVKLPKANSGQRSVGIEFDGKLEAHVVFKFVALNKHNILQQNIEVLSWTYSTRRGLRELFQFFRKQADQVSRVVFLTQDSHLQYLFSDPLDGSDNNFRLNHQISERGIGIMYRMVDPAQLIEQLAGHNFGGVNLTCGIDLQDGFWEPTSGSFELEFQDGRARVLKNALPSKVRLKISVGDFSSMLLGALPLDRLLDYGTASLSDPAVRADLEQAFHVREAPRCTTGF